MWCIVFCPISQSWRITSKTLGFGSSPNSINSSSWHSQPAHHVSCESIHYLLRYCAIYRFWPESLNGEESLKIFSDLDLDLDLHQNLVLPSLAGHLHTKNNFRMIAWKLWSKIVTDRQTRQTNILGKKYFALSNKCYRPTYVAIKKILPSKNHSESDTWQNGTPLGREHTVPPPGWIVYILYATDRLDLNLDLNQNRIGLFLLTHPPRFVISHPQLFEISCKTSF